MPQTCWPATYRSSTTRRRRALGNRLNLRPNSGTVANSTNVSSARTRNARRERPAIRKRSTLSATVSAETGTGHPASIVSEAARSVCHSDEANALPGATLGNTRYETSSNVHAMWRQLASAQRQDGDEEMANAKKTWQLAKQTLVRHRIVTGLLPIRGRREVVDAYAAEPVYVSRVVRRCEHAFAG